jgi:hypothetical protein
LERVAIWPVFLDRTMHEDMGVLFAGGDTVSWDVILVDGEADGWPRDRLIETEVRIDGRPAYALHGLLATTPELAVCWQGKEPVGSAFTIRAGLAVDLFNPPFRSTTTDRRATNPTVARPQARRPGRRAGPWVPRRARGAFSRDPTFPEPRHGHGSRWPAGRAGVTRRIPLVAAPPLRRPPSGVAASGGACVEPATDLHDRVSAEAGTSCGSSWVCASVIGSSLIGGPRCDLGVRLLGEHAAFPLLIWAVPFGNGRVRG